MLIENTVLEHWIDNFYGYGSWSAKFWFVAYEEGGGDLPEEVAEKLGYFYKAHPRKTASLCDIRELYKHVTVRLDGPRASSFKTLYEYRFGNNAIQHNVWKNLIAFEHAYLNEKLPDLPAYQRATFASPQAHREALIRLYPLPSPHNHAWYYSWLDLPTMGFLKSRALYQEHLFKRRLDEILSNIVTHKPDVVLMYGMENITALKASVQTFFHDIKFKMIKATAPNATAGQIPQHHRVDVEGTTILVTTQIPALRHNRIETGFDWEAFAKKARADTPSI
ncbi:MAG TPA: hypothetical protein VF490_15005 [Chryseosolibacter sp.]